MQQAVSHPTSAQFCAVNAGRGGRGQSSRRPVQSGRRTAPALQTSSDAGGRREQVCDLGSSQRLRRARCEVTELVRFDRRAHEAKRRMANGRGHPTNLPVSLFDDLELEPARRGTTKRVSDQPAGVGLADLVRGDLRVRWRGRPDDVKVIDSRTTDGASLSPPIDSLVGCRRIRLEGRARVVE